MAESSGKHLHAGHRVRLKERFRAAPRTFEDHELLELLLFYCIPQKDTNALAHRLLRRFGSLGGVLEAPTEQIRTVEGMGDASALLFPVMKEYLHRYLSEKSEVLRPVAQVPPEQLGDRILPEYFGLSHERVMIVGMNAKHRVVGSSVVGEGSEESSSVDMQRIADFVGASGAKYAVLAHNHPSGVGLPSPADIAATEQISDFLRYLGVELEDHIIFDGNGDYVSFAQSGLLHSSLSPDYSVISPDGRRSGGVRKVADLPVTPLLTEIMETLRKD